MSGFNFTEDLRVLIASARNESMRFHHEYIGTEHLLLGYASGKVPAAVRLLEALSVDPARVRKDIEDVVKPGQNTEKDAARLPYTSRTQKCFENAAAVARETGQDFVGIKHLLAGIVREGKGIGAQVLANRGVTEQAVAALFAEPG